eukprot:12681856-Ditylum_brightwellii.AAC.1
MAPLEDGNVFIEIPAEFYHKSSDSTKAFNELIQTGHLKQVYIDDTIFFAPDDSTINKENSIKFTCSENGDIHMSQPALISSIINLLGLKDNSKKHRRSAVHPPLQPYKITYHPKKHGHIDLH